MKTRTVLIWTLLYVFVFCFATESKAAVSEAALNHARQLAEQKNLGEAKRAYEKLLTTSNMSADEVSTLRREYEDISMSVVFSKTPTDTAEKHVVAPGDSLYRIARKYNTTIDLVKRSNGLESDVIHPGMELKVEKGPFSIHVDKSDNVLVLRLNGDTVKRYRVATGTNNGTPTGDFKIINKLVEPTWYNAGAVVSPDSPENILGTRWMGFDKPGYGIHGTTLPETIGTQATAGCVRMLNEEVEELFSIVPHGTKVTIVD